MKFRDKMFLESKAWAAEKRSFDTGYFNRLGRMHTPEILWIACADNLVSVEELANAEPGEILVCRNLASQVREDDIGMMALIEDVVLKGDVKHIVVCGYSHCSGVDYVLSPERDQSPHVGRWLDNLYTLYDAHREELSLLGEEEKKRRLAELNIELQVRNLSQLGCIQKAWEKRDRPVLYGWYFDLDSGSLHEVCSMERNDRLRKVNSLSALEV